MSRRRRSRPSWTGSSRSLLRDWRLTGTTSSGCVMRTPDTMSCISSRPASSWRRGRASISAPPGRPQKWCLMTSEVKSMRGTGMRIRTIRTGSGMSLCPITHLKSPQRPSGGAKSPKVTLGCLLMPYCLSVPLRALYATAAIWLTRYQIWALPLRGKGKITSRYQSRRAGSAGG